VTDAGAHPRFVADHMLGSLARWLRMMGYDTVYDKALDDAGISRLARAENRFILTRDKELGKEPGSLLIEKDDLDSQLRDTAKRYGLRFDESRIRCSQCNGELVDLPKDEAEGKVPQGAFAANQKFWRCSRCGKLYWKGTHWNGITDRLRKLNLA
jgi:uncharacterized protein with PIN domain